LICLMHGCSLVALFFRVATKWAADRVINLTRNSFTVGITILAE